MDTRGTLASAWSGFVEGCKETPRLYFMPLTLGIRSLHRTARTVERWGRMQARRERATSMPSSSGPVVWQVFAQAGKETPRLYFLPGVLICRGVWRGMRVVQNWALHGGA